MSETRRCPECWLELQGSDAWTVKVWGCASCGGVWLDNAASRALVERPEPRLVELTRGAAVHAPRRTARVRDPRPCPVCQSDMVVTPVWAATVHADVCTDHGTWLDASELQLVARTARQKAAGATRPAVPHPARTQPRERALQTELRELKRALRIGDEDALGANASTVASAVLGISLSILAGD